MLFWSALRTSFSMHDPQSSLTDLPHRLRQQAGDFKSNYRLRNRGVLPDPRHLDRLFPRRAG
jgi:hypothetical protein